MELTKEKAQRIAKCLKTLQMLATVSMIVNGHKINFNFDEIRDLIDELERAEDSSPPYGDYHH